MTATPLDGRAGRPSRVVFIDALRLLATVQMVQGHTLDAVMGESYRAGSAFAVWTYVRGLTSVAFLFAAGLSFDIATLARFERHRANPLAVRARVKRGFLLVVVGYLLHFPLGSLLSRGDLRAALVSWSVVDILQCSGVSLLVLEGLTLALPTAAFVRICCAVIGVAFVALAPALAALRSNGLAVVWMDYVNSGAGSLFPLFPWAAPMFLGVAVSGFVCGRGAFTTALRLGAFGGLLLAISVGVSAFLHPAGHATERAWADLPMRLGIVSLVAAVLAGALARVSRLPLWMERVAGKTLTIYAAHLLVLYGDVVGLSSGVGRQLSPTSSALLALVVLALSVTAALGWDRFLRRGRPPLAYADRSE